MTLDYQAAAALALALTMSPAPVKVPTEPTVQVKTCDCPEGCKCDEALCSCPVRGRAKARSIEVAGEVVHASMPVQTYHQPTTFVPQNVPIVHMPMNPPVYHQPMPTYNAVQPIQYQPAPTYTTAPVSRSPVFSSGGCPGGNCSAVPSRGLFRR